MRGPLLEFWHGLTPLSRGLLGFFLANCLLLNLALHYSPWPHQQMTALSYTRAFLERTAHDDSWRPMRSALLHLDRRPDQPLYQSVFFEQGEKFQYAPTSLLALDALRRLPHPSHSTVDQALDWVERLRPKRAYFTHICHDLGHEETNAELPRGVELAYDGLIVETSGDAGR